MPFNLYVSPFIFNVTVDIGFKSICFPFVLPPPPFFFSTTPDWLALLEETWREQREDRWDGPEVGKNTLPSPYMPTAPNKK